MEQRQKSVFISFLITIGLYFSGLFVFLTPLPLIYHAFKYNEKSALNAAGLSFLFVAAVYIVGTPVLENFYKEHPNWVWLFPAPKVALAEHFGQAFATVMGIGYFMLFVFIGAAVSMGLKKENDQAFSFFSLSLIIIFLGTTAFIVALVFSNQETHLAAYQNMLQSDLREFILAQEQAGLDLQQIVYLKNNQGEIIQYSYYMLPFLLFLSVASLFVLNLVVAKRFFLVFFPRLQKITLTLFKLPFALVWTTIALLSVLLLNHVLLQNQVVFFGVLNVLFGIALTYFFQGFAVFVHFLEQKKITGFFRMFIYVMMLLMFQASSFILVCLGFFDSWMDVRKLEPSDAGTS